MVSWSTVVPKSARYAHSDVAVAGIAIAGLTWDGLHNLIINYLSIPGTGGPFALQLPPNSEYLAISFEKDPII